MPLPELVTLAQAKAHLRVDHSEDDDDIDQKRLQATAVVLNYLWLYERTEFQTLPVFDPANPWPISTPWPWPTPLVVPPYWWPATRVSYQNLAPLPDWFGGSPFGPAPYDIQAAVLLIIGSLYRDRESGDPINAAVRALLAPHRDPVMA